MCGIGGILRVWSPEQRAEALATPPVRAIPEAWLDVIDDAVKHRGPDGRGRFRDRLLRPDGSVVDVALVHRRLSILDHAGGHQPMLSLGKGRGVVTGTRRLMLGEGLGLYERNAASELAGGGSTAAERIDHGVAGGTEKGSGAGERSDGVGGNAALSDRVCVVFNGCIYNHRELRAQLQAAGHVFTSDHSDTEVLVHGWREWGPSLFRHLDSMHAMAIWDAAAGTLTFSRDHSGEKPLYEGVPRNARWLVFGSTVPAVMRGLMASGFDEAAQISDDSRWILRDHWLRYGYGFRPPSAWIQEVDPSVHRALEPSTGEVSVAIIHEADDPLPERQTGSPFEANEAETLIREAVRSRLHADVEWGCFLSGGVDSSLVAAIAASLARGLRTFSVRMPDARFDESPTATRVASIIGTRHTVLDCDQRPAEDLLTLVDQLGLPFGDSSLLPTHWVSRAARSHVTVAIGGDGADELFGGYERYRAAFALQRFRRLLAKLPIHPGGAHPRGRRAKLARLVAAARADGYHDLLAIFPAAEWETLTGGELRSRAGSTSDDPLRDDFTTYLPQDLLRKTDTASMACALELRSPYLSRALVDACLSAPLSSLMPRGQRKGLLRQVARKYLPSEIVDRPKMGFAIPIGEWFRSDYGGLRTMLLDHLNSAEPFGPPSLGIELNMAYVRQMLDEHLGTGPSGVVKRDHSQRLYMLLVLSIWAKWLGGLR
ncbi:MAG: asparagine synthase (glutamine-hydrolyzing) [Phycisphaeraceae bacterium]|nr:asparagine synthase (glutamine-hydrolyzing) [Phycisphaeraceae bacterium]